MEKCVIVTSYINGYLSSLLSDIDYDYLICADGGYTHAFQAGLKPDLVIGDFDSSSFDVASGIEVLKLPVEKDDTDTLYCIKYAIENGANEIYVIGGLGGRADHSMANLESIKYANRKGVSCTLIDQHNRIFMESANDCKLTSVEIPKREGWHLSIFPFCGVCKGVSLKGTKYPLKNYDLEDTFPIGVSNEIEEDTAVISFKKGDMLIILSRD